MGGGGGGGEVLPIIADYIGMLHPKGISGWSRAVGRGCDGCVRLK